MNRREAIQRVAVLMGGTMLGAESLLAKNVNWDAVDEWDYRKGLGIFSKNQVKLMNEVADTILPDTGTPGAKAAKVGPFIAVVVSDCYEPAEQQEFLAGLAQLDTACVQSNGKPFLKCKGTQGHDFLVALDKEAKAKGGDASPAAKFFDKFKDLTIWGYFTSEIGATQALRLVEIPGRYDGCMPYQKGDKAFGGY